MTHIIACPSCGRNLQVPQEALGRTVQCPDCQHQFVAAPATGVQSSSPAAPAPSPPGRFDDEEDSAEIARPPGAPHRGGMVLAFGILALVVCPVFGIVAWLMGNSDLAAMQEGTMDRSGEGITQAGRVLGMIGFGLFVLWVVVACLMVGVFAVAG